MLYNQMPKKYSFIVEVMEIPAIGRNGQINIMADDKLVYSFFLLPKEEYLEAQANASFKMLQDFDMKRKQIDREFPY